MSPDVLAALLAATVQAGAPILFATLGEMLSERAGVLNLGVEGVMALAAFAAFFVCHLTGSAWLGLVAGALPERFCAACTRSSASSFSAIRWSPAWP